MHRISISLFVLCLLLVPACGLLFPSRLHTERLVLQGKNISFSLPKGGRSATPDSTNGEGYAYKWGGGATLFFHPLPDTNLYTFDTTVHIAQPQAGGGRFYKAQDSTGRFWREVRKGYLRFGYRGVSSADEDRFDSSLNSLAKSL